MNGKEDTPTTVRWDLQYNTYGTQQYLNETHESLQNPDKITIPLYAPQQKALAAMWRLERRGGLSINNIPRRYNNENTNDRNKNNIISDTLLRVKVQTNMGVLSNPLGSGKTLVALSLIALSPMPPARLISVDCTRDEELSNMPIRINSNSNSPILKTHPRYTRLNVSFKKRIDKILRPALVFSGRPALRQWLHAVKTQTTMKAFVVENVYHLRIFKHMIDDGSINDYDIIIVKSGKFSGRTVFPDIIPKPEYVEHVNSLCSKEFYSVICNMTRNLCFSRVIIDDFDQINLPRIMGHINALFTWFISCTTRITGNTYPGFRQKGVYKYDKLVSMGEIPSIESYMYRTYMLYEELLKNRVLFSNFNICCTNNLIKNTMSIGQPTFYTYTLKNPDDHLIAALGAMGDKNVTEIFEMLNGDAIDEAAEKAGIASMNTKDIFQKILADKYESWETARKILYFISVENTHIADRNRISMDSNPNKKDTYGKLNLRKFRPILYRYHNLHWIFEEEHTQWTIVKAENGKSIERVQNNLQASVCAVCCCSLNGNIATQEEDDFDELDDFMADMAPDMADDKETESKSVIMMKCCGITVCAGCGMRGSNFRRTHYYKNTYHGKEFIVGLCVNCKIEIVFEDLIFINKDFDHDQIILENMESDDIIEEKEDEKEEKVVVKNRNKIDILLDIINGISPQERKNLDKKIPNLMMGTAELPKAKPEEVKVLVFANYDESLLKVAQRLDENSIPYDKLGGTGKDIHRMSLEFNDKDLNVLLINSVKYCASLNLQSATDVVFMHKILNANVESQVSGRAQRIGRKHHLNIHYVLYDNEHEYL